jgi:hypothetical protein
MPSDMPNPYRSSLQILRSSPTQPHLFSVHQSSSLRLLVHSSGQAFCWPASDQHAAPLASCAEAHRIDSGATVICHHTNAKLRRAS